MRPSRSTARFEMKCKECGITFDANMKTRMFCTDVCQRKNYKKRNKKQ